MESRRHGRCEPDSHFQRNYRRHMAPLSSPLVSAEELAAAGTDVRIVDSRWYLDGRSGRAAFEAGHIAGAVFADLDVDLSAPVDPAGGGRHPLPEPAAFAAAMGALGIADTDHVVVYDDMSGAIAARLWWMLDSLGVRASVLDGGIDAWDGPLELGPAFPEPAVFAPADWPADRFVDADTVAARSDTTVLLDARSAERHRGEPNPVDPRFGHIPGALSAPWTDNVEAGHMRSSADLGQAFDAHGITPDTDVITSCGSGVTACHDLLALRLAGVEGTRLYVGSWSEWGADPGRPIETG